MIGHALAVLGHFAFEAMIAGIGLALIAAGLALLAAPQSFIVSRIPVVGGFVASIRTGAATVAIAAGVACLAFVGGYAWRGSSDQSAALRDQIATEQALRDIAEVRADAFNIARRRAESRADDLAADLRTLADRKEKDDALSAAHDADSCLAADSVLRLNAIRRPRHRR